MITPLSSQSFDNMQINAGVFLLGFDYTQYNTLATLKAAVKTKIAAHGTDILGATRGGGTFTVTKSTREIDADGKRASFVGSTIIDSVDASITGTALEITPDNVKRVFAAGTVTDSSDGKVHTIKMRTFIEDNDYLENLCWVGEKVDGGMVLIAFDNALNTADVSMNFTDKGEMTMPFEFHANQDDVAGDDYAPFALILLDA